MSMPTASKPPVSERKAIANRANALKSTGPKTAAGKAKVSLNAITHGLCTEMIVLPGEDPDKFEALQQAWMDDWKPQSQAERVLVERLTAGDWRLQRCVRNEKKAIDARIVEAITGYDARAAENLAEGIGLFFGGKPKEGLMLLRDQRDGVRWMIRTWTSLAEHSSDSEQWGPVSHETFRGMLSLGAKITVEDVEEIVETSEMVMIWNNPNAEADEKEIATKAEADEKAAEIDEIVHEQLAACRARLATFPDPREIRQQLAEEITFDFSPESLTLHRHEDRVERGFRANLTALQTLVKTGRDLIAAQEVDETEEPEPAPTLVEQNKATESAAEATNKAEESAVPAQATPILPPRPSDDGQVLPDLHAVSDFGDFDWQPIHE